MTDCIFVALQIGLFAASIYALKAFTFGQGKSAGREE